MWEISNSLQAVCFLRAIILGLILSLFYDIFSSLRKLGLNSFFAVLIEDIIFFAVATPVVFLFLMATTNGEVRLYIIIGIIIGFLILKLTLSKLIVFVLYKLLFVIKKMFLSLFKIYNLCFTFIESTFSLFLKKSGKLLKKALNSLKKLLKKQ